MVKGEINESLKKFIESYNQLYFKIAVCSDMVYNKFKGKDSKLSDPKNFFFF